MNDKTSVGIDGNFTAGSISGTACPGREDGQREDAAAACNLLAVWRDKPDGGSR
jgi:hypothetical protein